MISPCYEKAKAFLMTPVVELQKSREDSTGSVLKYYILIALFNAILTALIAFLLGGNGILNTLSVLMNQLEWVFPIGGAVGEILIVILVAIFAVIFLFVFAIWLHICVYITGGRKGYMYTVKALAYGSTPGMIIGWIPVIGPIIGGIWTLVLEVMSVREIHQISTERAAIAVILAVMIPIIILLLLFAALLSTMMSGATTMSGKYW
jgi:hypothetical protein